MPYRILRFEDTPNPNAVKCVLDRPTDPQRGARSFLNAESARADPLAAALFAIPGVRNILMHEDWITVNKRPEAAWKAIKPAVRRVLESPEPPP